ncbi:hypothetical protein CCP3SC1AL1_140021 [Gammaproteobacteria bacterium]
MRKEILFGCIFLLSGCAADSERVADTEQQGKTYSEAKGDAKSPEGGGIGGFFKTVIDAIPGGQPDGQDSPRHGKNPGHEGRRHGQGHPQSAQSHQERSGHQNKHHQQPNCSGDMRPANRDGRTVCVPKK